MASLPTRRLLFGAAAAALVTRPATAAPSRFQTETDVWTGSVLQDEAGGSFTLRDLSRPVTLLKLWAGWCPACASEMPHLAALASALERSVDVVLVSHPQFWDADRAAARRRRLPFRLATLADTNPGPVVQQALLDGAGQYAVPRSLVFRQRDYAVVAEMEGAKDWGSDAIRGRFKGWLG